MVMCGALQAACADTSDYMLNIFGNANMDDAIDEKDIAYVEGIIKGANAPTNLSDANYDGLVDAQDIDQIQKIIDGEDEEITLIDSANRTVTIKKPIDRVITLGGYDTEIMYMMGEQDKIVGIADWFAMQTYYKACLPKHSELPTFETSADIDFERVIALNPDVLFTWHYYGNEIEAHLPNVIPVACFDFFDPEIMREEMAKFGYLFNKKGWEKSYFEEFHDKYIDLIKAKTDGISDDMKPLVYSEKSSKAYNTFPDRALKQKIETSGGKLMFSEVKTNRSYIEISPEEVISRNPDIIIKDASSRGPYTGYDIDDKQKPKPLRDEIMNRTELANVSAVKNGTVYILDVVLRSGPLYPVAVAYYAKIFHPDLFKDLDPRKVHQAYLDCIGSNYGAEKHGVFVYPPLEEI
jgi:iron complex transport system substrate-binding protein